MRFANVISNVVTRVSVANNSDFLSDPEWVANNPGLWIDVTSQPEVAAGWTYNPGDGSFTAPAKPPEPNRFLLSNSEWIGTFTDDEWQWLLEQRSETPPTAASKQLNKMMDQIAALNSIDVSDTRMDPFYNWMLNQGIPGGQTRIDELREGIPA